MSAAPEIRHLLFQDLVARGCPYELADELLDYAESVGRRLRDERLAGEKSLLAKQPPGWDINRWGPFPGSEAAAVEKGTS